MSTDPSEAETKVVALRPVAESTRLFDWLLPPTNATEAMATAKMLAESNFVPKDYRGRPGDVLVCMQYGKEIGVQPVQALQGIAVINGRPCVWGDLAMAVVEGSGKLDWKHEYAVVGGQRREWKDVTDADLKSGDVRSVCEMLRKGRTEPMVQAFSIADAKTAGLWGKQGPWSSYPKRMLQMRSRSWVIRDEFSDVLKGLSIGEEVQDIDVAPEHFSSHIEQPRALDTPPTTGTDGATTQASLEIIPPPSPTGPPPASSTATEFITDPQRRELFRTAGDAGRTIADLKAKLESLGIASTAQIPASRFAEILSWARDEPALPPEPGMDG